jgi:signal transduction histidine kinase
MLRDGDGLTERATAAQHAPALSPLRSGRLTAGAVWAACLAAVALVAGSIGLGLLTGGSGRLSGEVGRYAYLTLALPISLAGALIAFRRPGNRVGALMLLSGASVACDQFSFDYVHYRQARGQSPGWAIGWVSDWMWVVPLAALLFGLLLFPGELPGGRAGRVSRGLAGLIGVWTAITAGLAALGVGEYEGSAPYPGVVPPGPVFDVLHNSLAAVFGLFQVLLLGVAVAVVLRFRRARGVERSQLKWLAYAGSLVALAWALPPVQQVDTWPRAIANLMLWTLPAAIAIAVLRYRLYDIDRLINRTLVYASLTACVGGGYLAVVAVLSAVVDRRSGLVISMLASLVVAVIFAPLRARLQRAVDRLLYGQRREPSTVLSRLGRRLDATLEPEHVLPTIVETVGQALKLPYVAIELRQEGTFKPACVRGTLTGEPVELPLTYRGEMLGRLVLGPRAPGEPFSPPELELLQDLARHAGVTVHAVRLTADLQRSRERLVSAREEERRRLRRDLHDGVGPTLAGAVFQLEAGTHVLATDPDRAGELLAKVKGDLKGTIAEVRRLVDGLRPPALDELGLMPAIRQHGARLTGVGGPASEPSAAVAIEVLSSSTIPQLPAAVEVAVYRIATEAMTNVLRHAQAQRCTVELRYNDGPDSDVLELEVTDDGRGITGTTPDGFGQRSIRERAAELGGSCEIESGPGSGTRVFVRLPIALGG